MDSGSRIGKAGMEWYVAVVVGSGRSMLGAVWQGRAGMERGVKLRCCLDERGTAGMASRGVPMIGSVCQVKSRIGVAKALDILPNM